MASAINTLLEIMIWSKGLTRLKNLSINKNSLLEKNNAILYEILTCLKNISKFEYEKINESENPSLWVKDDPWIEVLGKRR